MIEIPVWVAVVIAMAFAVVYVVLRMIAHDTNETLDETKRDLELERGTIICLKHELATLRNRYIVLADEKRNVELMHNDAVDLYMQSVEGKIELQKKCKELETELLDIQNKYKELEHDYEKLEQYIKWTRPTHGGQGCCMKPVKNVGESCDWEGR